jgi:hypothetical protein
MLGGCLLDQFDRLVTLIRFMEYGHQLRSLAL